MRADPSAAGDGLWFLNTWVVVRKASAETPDGLSVTEHWMPFGDSPPLHVHHREDEIFHILEGEVRFKVGDAERLARAGESLVAPKGVPHTFRVESPEGARMIVMAPGADFEGLIRGFSRPAERAALPEAMAPTPDMVEALVSACRAQNIEVLGPPLAA